MLQFYCLCMLGVHLCMCVSDILQEPIERFERTRLILQVGFAWTYSATHTHAHARTHTHTHSFNGPLSRTTQVSRYQKGKTNLDLLKQETVSGSGISWAICKSAPHSRQITMPALHPTTEMMPFLPPSQQRQSTEGMNLLSQLLLFVLLPVC